MKQLFFMMSFMLLGFSNIMAQTSITDDNPLVLEETTSSDVELKMTSIVDVKQSIINNITKFKTQVVDDVGKLIQPTVIELNNTVNTELETLYSLVNDVGKSQMKILIDKYQVKKDYSVLNKLLSYDNK